jgi:thiamine biosynthesis lipoprotein
LAIRAAIEACAPASWHNAPCTYFLQVPSMSPLSFGRRGGLRQPVLAAMLCLLVALAACSRPPAVYQQENYVFGTRVEVLVYGEPEDHARAAVDAVLREFDRLHRMLHAWQPSELTTLNDAIAAGRSDVPVSPELARLLVDARAMAEQGEELFDPAIGRLIGLWGFHNDEFKAVIPPRQEIEALVSANPRMSDLRIAGDRVSCGNRRVQIDLGGYAKGYALDRAAAILHEQGVNNALINIGGNVMALGRKGDRAWRVGIQHPRQPGALASLELRDGEAIGTSGDYQRYFELDGRRYSHLIDPRSGYPATDTQAVTILITPRPGAGTLSDGASKPLFIGGAEQWRRLARKFGIDDVLRVDAAGRVTVTAAMKQRLELEPNVKIDAVVD